MRYVKFLILALGLVAVGATAGRTQLFMMDNPNTGKSAPEFTLPTLSGRATALSAFREGKKAIIFFWATWCPHCRAALKELNERQKEFVNKDIRIVLVDVGEPAAVVKKYVEKYKVTLEVFLDEDEGESEKYDIIGVPTFFFVNKEGVIKEILHQLPENYDEILSKP